MAARVERGQTHDVKDVRVQVRRVYTAASARETRGRSKPSPTERRGQGAAPPWLPLTRELSAQLTEGEKNRRFCKTSLFSPSVKTCGFATSLVRGRRKFSPAWQRPRCGRCSPPIASLCSTLPPMGEARGKNFVRTQKNQRPGICPGAEGHSIAFARRREAYS